ncbi:MAG: hypothetical protein J4F31_08180 [Flavobacteriales bacterium]|nr:hypothetical protein [Flavobacteriales bacterium]
MNIKRLAFFLLMSAAFLACKHDPLKVDTSEVQMEVNYLRFDDAFFGTPVSDLPEALPELQREFPEFFLVGQTTEEWIEVRKDPLLNMLYDRVSSVHPDISVFKSDVEMILKHFKYYYPSYPSSVKVFTYVSGLDYEYPVISADSMYFISIDMFLGPDTVYDQFPQYLAKHFDPTYFPAKFARAIAEPLVEIDRTNGSFLAKMLYEGRVLYLMEALMSEVNENIVIEYTPEELAWAKEHEQEIWTFFVEDELLFSNENGLYDRFIAEAPFSKFYAKIDRESPGRIGRWIGWQIVRSYMKAHPETTVQELASMSETRILFKNAQYKPLR